MKIKLGFRKLFKKEKDPAPAYSGSVDDLKDSISPPTPIPPSPSQSPSPSASISVKDFKRRSSSELLKQPAVTAATPPFKTRRKPPPNPNLSSWHSSDESDDVRDNDFEKFKSRIRQTRETRESSQIPSQRLSAMRKANTELAVSDSDSDSDDTLPLSQLRSKSQVSLVNSVASKPNKSTPSLKLQGSSHKLNYRKPPAPASVRESRQSRDIKHSSTLSPTSLSPNYQRQSHASYSPQSRQSHATLRPPPSPVMSMHSAPGASANYFNPYMGGMPGGVPGMPNIPGMGMPGMPGVPGVPGMPSSFPYPQAPLATNLPTPPPSAPSSSNGDLNQQAAVAAQMHFQAMMNAKHSFQAYVAQHAAYLAGQQWDEEHSQYGGSEAGGYSLNDEDYYMKGAATGTGAKSDYGGVSPSSANSRRSSNYLQSQQAQARAQMRYSQSPRKASSRDSLKPPPPPPTIKHYRGQSNASSVPKNPTKLRSQSTLSMR